MSFAACGNCRYYERFSQGYGLCRYWPPQLGETERVYAGRSGITGIWPVVCVEDWCGQYKEMPWKKGTDAMDDPPPVPDPPEGGVVSTAAEMTAVDYYDNRLGDPARKP